jgi:hypothetical protein
LPRQGRCWLRGSYWSVAEPAVSAHVDLIIEAPQQATVCETRAANEHLSYSRTCVSIQSARLQSLQGRIVFDLGNTYLRGAASPCHWQNYIKSYSGSGPVTRALDGRPALRPAISACTESSDFACNACELVQWTQAPAPNAELDARSIMPRWTWRIGSWIN